MRLVQQQEVLVQRAPRRIPQGAYKAPLSKRRQRRALRVTPCTSPLVQIIGMGGTGARGGGARAGALRCVLR
jgi:hypothetical protein